jgi:hypothetical protein
MIGDRAGDEHLPGDCRRVIHATADDFSIDCYNLELVALEPLND